MSFVSDGNVLLAACFALAMVSLGGAQPSAVAMPSEGRDRTPAMPYTSAPKDIPATHAADISGESRSAREHMSHEAGTRALSTPPPSESCLATLVCEVKERLRWRTPAWTQTFCGVIARAVLKAAAQYQLPPALILAVMINESDLNENAIVTTYKNGHVYAKDGGLMGIRCVLDSKGRCANPTPHGLPWQEVMSPVNNIMLGSRELAYWRDVGGIERIRRTWRDSQGGVHTQEHTIHCRHQDHAYWAHYNHGLLYLAHGRARHYPHRVAVVYYALAQAMSLDTTALTSMNLTVRDPGQRVRTADRPVELRYRKICQSIRTVGPRCDSLATVRLAGPQ